MSRRHRLWPWYAAILGLVVLDQTTKELVRQSLTLHESLPLLGRDLLRLTHVQNPGIAFGLQVFGPTFLLVFGWVAAVALAVYLRALASREDLLCWPLMLFVAGAIGNSIDRLFFGQVTDFIDADFPDFIMPRWPVFNVADSCVTIGIILLALIILIDRRKPGAPTEAHLDSVDNHVRDHTPSAPASDNRAGATPVAD